MKNYVIIGVVLLFLGYGGVKVYTGTRGLRNNNAGNIRKNPAFTWNGETGQDDAGFVIFDKPINGLRALMRLLRNYQNNSGLKSVYTIISRYAPTTENNTAAYVKHVSNLLGVDYAEDINLNNEETLINLAKAVVKHENGINPYSNDLFKAAHAII